jgi:hypothetical protein
MAETTSDIAQGLSAAITGPGTPAGITVKRASAPVLWAVFGALGLVLLGVAVVIEVLAYGPWWHDSEPVALARIGGLKWIGWLLCGDVVLLVAAIALPGGIGKIEASAGANSVKIEGQQ